MQAFNLTNGILGLFALLVFLCSIHIVKVALQDAASYSVDQQALYAAVALWVTIFALQITIVVTYKKYQNALIIVSVIRFFTFYVIQCTLLYWVKTAGHGLTVTSVLLTTGQITF